MANPWKISSAWKIPSNTFSLFGRKEKPYYGKALDRTELNPGHKQAIEDEEVEEDSKGNVHVSNATSWDNQTHPKGAGPSNLVDDIDYNNDTKDLTVKYRDGFVAVYHNIDRGDVWTFSTAASKGRWALENLWDLPYDRG
jgi:hypothetical protein